MHQSLLYIYEVDTNCDHDHMLLQLVLRLPLLLLNRPTIKVKKKNHVILRTTIKLFRVLLLLPKKKFVILPNQVLLQTTNLSKNKILLLFSPIQHVLLLSNPVLRKKLNSILLLLSIQHVLRKNTKIKLPKNKFVLLQLLNLLRIFHVLVLQLHL